MAEMYLKRTLSGFAPDDADAVASCKRIPVGTTVRCEITQPRSVRQLRYYWALCSLCSLNSEQFHTREQVDQFIRLATGHVDLVTVGNETYKLPRRIAFSKLSQDEWFAYLVRAKDVVAREILPGVTMPELENELARMVT